MKCKNNDCGEELTFMEESKCFRCLKCKPIVKKRQVPKKSESKYIDVPWTEDRIRKIVREELEDWHIQKPPVTKKEIDTITEQPVATWREQAKELGIPLYHKTKKQVLAEIVEKTKASQKDNNDHSQE